MVAVSLKKKKKKKIFFFFFFYFFFFFFFFFYFFFFFGCFFFFQAEDGIRDRDVTGVQTCALPISIGVYPGRRRSSGCFVTRDMSC